jgi:hypothetical protein
MWDAIRVDRQIAVKWPDMARSDFSLSIYMTVPGDS